MYQEIRAIRVALAVIVTAHVGHETRNRKLRVLRDMIRDVMDRYDVLGAESLLDGLRAMHTLAHDTGLNSDLGRTETHHEVKIRLRLIDEIAVWLVQKAEQDGMGPIRWISSDSPPRPRNTEDIPF